MILRTRSQFRKRFEFRGLGRAAAFCLLALMTACSGLPARPEIDAGASDFSSRRARAHFAALAELHPRPAGSEAAARARAYVERELRWVGAEIEDREDEGARSILAWLPGSSADRLLVVAPWSAGGEGGGPDDAGVATLLELARALSRRPLPYTVGFAAPTVPPSSDSGSREEVRASGAALVELLKAQAMLDAIRAVIIVEPRAEAPGQIARDLRSHPVFRDLFWRTAARLGHEATFSQEAGWSTPEGVQGAFLSAGYGRVLSLVDDRTDARGAEGAPALPDPDAFQPVGTVAYEGLLQLMARFVRVDAFSP